MPTDLDKIDIKILNAVQEDASLTGTTLAERVGLSPSPCWRRLQRLRDEGYIKKDVALLDRKKLGLDVQIFALVRLSAHGRANVSSFTDAVKKLAEVQECHITLGSMDCLLRIYASDMASYERFFFEKLSSIPGVQEVNSVVSLTEVKATTALPLR